MAPACAACKFQRIKCRGGECVFAPYFPPDQPKKFACVHEVFGASYVAKLLSRLPFLLREDAVKSLVFEAEARIRDPVYGCVGLISLLQQETDILRKEPASPQAMLPILQPQTQTQPSFMPPSASVQQQDHSLFPQVFNGQQQQNLYEMFREYGEGGNSSYYHQNQHQDEILRFNDGFESSVPTGSVTATGYNQLPSLALGGNNYVDTCHMNDDYHTDQQLHYHQQHEAHQFMPTQPFQPLPLQTHEAQTSSDLESS